MARINDFAVLDFSGGVNARDSDFLLKKNELRQLLNYDVDNRGKLKKRLGSHQFGTTGSGNVVSSTYWEQQALGSNPATNTIIATDASTSVVSHIFGTILTAAVAVGDTTITVTSTTSFAASGTIEIEGDIITYTGVSGGTTFTGVTGITSAHVNGNAVHQNTAMSGTSVDGTDGVYFAALNDLLMINGRAGSSTLTGTTMSAISDADEPAGLFATVYRQRAYVAGSGVADGSGNRNGARDRVAFSEPGDLTDWGDYTINLFDVEDPIGEQITALEPLSDYLLVFKQNSFFLYDEVRLRQQSNLVGAYNDYVVRRIGDLIYTFCPAGVYVTNGSQSERISDPVEKYIKDFIPTFTNARKRTVRNTFATDFDNKYILYIQDILNVGTLTDVVLIYDTIRKNWTVWNGFTDFQHFSGMRTFKYGNQEQHLEGLFGGDASGKFYRFFSKKFVNAGAPGTYTFITTGDLTMDLVSDTGNAINALAETPLYDFDTPGILKSVGYIRPLTETPGFQIEYRVENEFGISEWVSVGKTTKRNERLRLPGRAQGYRMAVRIADSEPYQTVLNGIIFEDINTISKR